MPTFQVEIKEVHTQLITVEAKDEQEARAEAEKVIAIGLNQDGSELPDELYFSYTLYRDLWDVWPS